MSEITACPFCYAQENDCDPIELIGDSAVQQWKAWAEHQNHVRAK